MKYTTDMEKALEKAHGVSFAEYESKLSTRMDVEKKRELDYETRKQIVAQTHAPVHR